MSTILTEALARRINKKLREEEELNLPDSYYEIEDPDKRSKMFQHIVGRKPSYYELFGEEDPFDKTYNPFDKNYKINNEDPKYYRNMIMLSEKEVEIIILALKDFTPNDMQAEIAREGAINHLQDIRDHNEAT